MSEESEVFYDGDVVWVKYKNFWWPGEVCGETRLPDGLMDSLRKKPIAVVKFFQEDTFEYVNSYKNIYRYDCDKKKEFIKRGMDLYRGAKKNQMEKFPADVATSETLTGGDPNIIHDEEFAPKEKRSSWAGIFQDTKKQIKNKSTPVRKGKAVSPTKTTPKNTPLISKIHEMRDLTRSTPSTSSTPTTPSAQYKCHLCGFQSNRQNVIILHTKSHASDSFKTPNRKGVKTPLIKTTPVKRGQKMKIELSDSESDEPVEVKKTPAKRGRKRKTPIVKAEKKKITSDDSSDNSDCPSKKVKTDAELKFKILADWSDPETSSDIEEKSVAKTENEDLILSEVEKKVISVVVSPPVTKYRNIPKKERREFVIEEDNVVLVAPIETSIRKSSRNTPITDGEPESEIKEPKIEKIVETTNRRSSRHTLKDSDQSRNSSISEKLEIIPKNAEEEINITLTVNERPRRYARKSTKSSSEDEVKKPEVVDEEEEKMVLEMEESKEEILEEQNPIIPEIEEIHEVIDEEEIPEVKDEEIPKVEEAELSEAKEEEIPEVKEIPEIIEEEIADVREEETIPEILTPEEIKPTEEMIIDEKDDLNNSSRNDISCFDFNEDDEEVVPKSPPRRRKRTSVILNSEEDIEEQIKLEEKDKELANEIDSLLNSTAVPAIPSLIEPSKSEEDIENKNRTLPPKERGKRIFKSRNRNKNKSPENISPSKSESDLPEDELKLKENGNHLKVEEKIELIETSEISINAAEVLVNLSETVLNNSQNISTQSELAVEEIKEIENIAPVSRKKHLLKAEVENNLRKSEIETVPDEIKPHSTLSLSPKQKFPSKSKEPEEVLKEEIEIPTPKPVPAPIKSVVSPSKQRKPSKPPQKLIKITEQLIKPVIVEDPTFLNDANFEQIKPKVHKTKKRKIVADKSKVTNQTIIENRIDSPVVFNQGPVFNASQMVITSKGAIITTQTQATSTTSQIHTKQRVSDSSKKCVVSHSGGTTSKVQVQSQEIIKQPPSKKISHSKRSIKRCRMTPEELQEMTSKGYIKSMPNGPVLTAEGYKSMRDKKIQAPIKVLKTAEEENVKLNTPELPPLVPLTPSPKKMRKSFDDLQSKVPPLVPSMSPTPTQIFCPEVKSPIMQTEQMILQEADITDVSQEKYIAVPASTFGGPADSFYLCTINADGNAEPINHDPLYWNNGSLLPILPEEPAIEETVNDSESFILKTESGDEIVLNYETLMAIAAGESPALLTEDGQQLILQGAAQDILSALREQNVIVQQHDLDQDILAVALADTNVLQQESRDILLGNPITQAATIETDTVLHQPPIMSTLENPTNSQLIASPMKQNLDESLAVIGVTATHSNIPASLELPITITNPSIASKTNQLNLNTIYTTHTSSSSSQIVSTAVTQGACLPKSPGTDQQNLRYLFDNSTFQEIKNFKTTQFKDNSNELPDELLQDGENCIVEDMEIGMAGDEEMMMVVNDDEDDNFSDIVPVTPESNNQSDDRFNVSDDRDDNDETIDDSNSNSSEIPLQPNYQINNNILTNHGNQNFHINNARNSFDLNQPNER